MKFSTTKYFLFFLILVLCNQVVFSQVESKNTYLVDNAKKLIYSDPEQALNITNLMLSKTDITLNEKAKIILLSAKAYKVKGDYSSVLKFLYQEKNYENYLSEKEKIEIELEKIAIFRELSLENEAQKKLTLLENSSNNNLDEDVLAFKNEAIKIEKSKFLLKKQDFSRGIRLLSDTKSTSNFSDLNLWHKIALAQLHLENHNFQVATLIFDESLKDIQKFKTENNYAKVFVLSGLAKVYFQEKEHAKAIKILLEASNYSKKLKNLFLQELITNQLNVNYLAINDTFNYKLTNVTSVQFQTEIESLEQEALNTAYNLISEEQKENYNQSEFNYHRIIYIILFIILAVLIVFGVVRWTYLQRKNRLLEIINYLEITRNNFINRITDKKEETKKVFIPKETELLLLNKLQKFENSKKFTNKDISLAVLSGQFETNTKYLSEVINSNYHVNFNTYINKLRINYIVEKLKNDSNFIHYKISYLAENCGFASHSSFATVFKTITGISPITFIDLLKNEKENTPNIDE